MGGRNWTSPEASSSRCITEHVTATLEYKLANYLELKGMGVGNFVSSPVFRVGGYDWGIRFYPDGSADDCEGDYASCFLMYLGQAEAVSAKYTLSMVEANGQEEVASFGVSDHVFNLDVGGKGIGYGNFAERWKLKSMSRAAPGGDGGCFTIRCVLTVRNESPPLELPGHLERMLRDGRGTDVTFSVGGEEFRAHRCILAARSPIFAAQLFGPMAEKDMMHVEVVDMEPTIFGMMLRYIYTDSMPPCSSDGGGGSGAPVMQHLLVAADRYAIDRLKQMCEEELCKGKRMDAETVATTLVLANQHHCERLKEACVAFMASKKFKKHLRTCSRPPSLERCRRGKKQPSIRRKKYFLRSSKKAI